MLLWIHDTRCESKLISAKFPMLGDDLSVWDFQSSMTFLGFSRKFYSSMFSRPCGNPDRRLWNNRCLRNLRKCKFNNYTNKEISTVSYYGIVCVVIGKVHKIAKRPHDAIITSLLRQNDIGHRFDVTMALSLRHVSFGSGDLHPVSQTSDIPRYS